MSGAMLLATGRWSAPSAAHERSPRGQLVRTGCGWLTTWSGSRRDTAPHTAVAASRSGRSRSGSSATRARPCKLRSRTAAPAKPVIGGPLKLCLPLASYGLGQPRRYVQRRIRSSDGQTAWTQRLTVSLFAGLVAAMITACGGATATRTITRAATSSRVQTAPIASSSYTSPVHLPLPFDSEEDAFVGDPDPQDQALHRSGCFAVVARFDNASVRVCDCASGELRSEGHSASELAATASSVRAGTNIPAGPRWFNIPIENCWARLDPNE
jgi:hypothetical protein